MGGRDRGKVGGREGGREGRRGWGRRGRDLLVHPNRQSYLEVRETDHSQHGTGMVWAFFCEGDVNPCHIFQIGKNILPIPPTPNLFTILLHQLQLEAILFTVREGGREGG